MINYSWDCKTVDVYPSDGGNENVVYNVHYRLTGEDSETAYIGDVIGTQVLDISNITNFVPLSSLTNEIITQWVKDAMGTETVAKLEENIAGQISQQAEPTSITITIDGE